MMLTLKQKLVLSVLRDNYFSYGAIIEAIELSSSGKHRFGTELRPLVRHMAQLGLIQIRYGHYKNSYRVDMRRKYYTITDKGIAALRSKELSYGNQSGVDYKS